MNRLILTAILFLVVDAVTIQPTYAEDFSRHRHWNISTSDAEKGSDTEVNAPSSPWRYEVVAATSAANTLAGVSPWYRLPGDDAVSWNAAGSHWQGPAGDYPRFDCDRPVARLSSSSYGYQPRIAWKAPITGTVSVGGTFGFGTSDNSVRTVEWAFAKRSGADYTLLASGTTNTIIEPTNYGIGSSIITVAGKDCHLRYPTQNGLPVTNRRFPLLVGGHGMGMDGNSGANTYQSLVPKGYFVVGPSFGSGFNPMSSAQHVSNVITELLGRTDLPVKINADRICYSGVSMGGIIGLTLYRNDRFDPRIKAIMPRLASTQYIGGTNAINWSKATPMLMMNSNDDPTVPPDPDDFAAAYAPKGYILVYGRGHDLGIGGTTIGDAQAGFLDFFIKGYTTGLNNLASACAARTPDVLTYTCDWTGATAPSPIVAQELNVSSYPALSNVMLEAGEELVWTFRAPTQTAPDADYFLLDEPLTLNFTPAPSAARNTWQKYAH